MMRTKWPHQAPGDEIPGRAEQERGPEVGLAPVLLGKKGSQCAQRLVYKHGYVMGFHGKALGEPPAEVTQGRAVV